MYLESFQRRSQSCSFPHMPEECTQPEVKRFLENIEHHAVTNPDMFALLFATMAQGLQSGIFDQCGGEWIPGAVDAETQRGDVFGNILHLYNVFRRLTFSSRRCYAGIEDGFFSLAANASYYRDSSADRSVSYEQR